MRFLFIPASPISLYDDILNDRAIGGTETAVVRLAQELTSMNCEVTVLTTHPNPPLSNPLYVPLSQAANLDAADVLIVLREFTPFFWNIKAKKRFYWSGDSYDQPVTIGLGDKRIADKIDGFLSVSNWQAQTMCRASGLSIEKSFVIGNGIHLPYFAESCVRNRYRIIYSSTPYRGLEHLLRLFPRIREKVPEAELIICSGLDVYASQIGSVPPGFQGEQVKLQRMREIAATMPGVKYIGSVKQRELADYFKTSTVLAYPNTFEETSCITAMEAIAGGCVPVASKRGALPETIGDCGILIDGMPGQQSHDDHFVTQCCELLQNDQKLEKYSKRCIARKAELSWSKVAERLLKICC